MIKTSYDIRTKIEGMVTPTTNLGVVIYIRIV